MHARQLLHHVLICQPRASSLSASPGPQLAYGSYATRSCQRSTRSCRLSTCSCRLSTRSCRLSGTDYVYLSNEVTRSFYEELLKIIHEAENALEEIFIDECTNTTKTMICNYYLPPCGDAARLTTPASVCPTACEEQSRRCPSQWTWFQQKLADVMKDPLNCSDTDFLLKFPHSCSNLVRKFL